MCLDILLQGWKSVFESYIEVLFYGVRPYFLTVQLNSLCDRNFHENGGWADPGLWSWSEPVCGFIHFSRLDLIFSTVLL